jgi:hypothetical protein
MRSLEGSRRYYEGNQYYASGCLEDEFGLPGDSIALYEEMMELGLGQGRDEESITEFSVQVLELVGVDLSNIVSLMVAYAELMVSLQAHRDGRDLRRRVRIFCCQGVGRSQRTVHCIPAFIGLATAIADGHLEQDRCRYRAGYASSLLGETKSRPPDSPHPCALSTIPVAQDG